MRGNLPRTRTKAIWYANPSWLRRPRRQAISRKSASRKLGSRIRRGRERAAKETVNGIRAWLFLRHVEAYAEKWRMVGES